MKKVNDSDKAAMLGTMLSAGESYSTTVFANILPSGVDLFSMCGAIGAILGSMFSDEDLKRRHNAYLGITQTGINLAVLNDFHNDKLEMTKKISFSEMTGMKIKEKKTYTHVTVNVGKKKYIFSVPKKLIGSQLTNQAEGAAEVAKLLNNALKSIKAA